MTVALGELCRITVGRTPARAAPEYWGQGHPWLSIADMNQGLSIRSTKEQITELGATRGRQIDPGTVLLSFKLSIGKVAIAAIPLYTNEAIAALPIRRPAQLDTKYLLRTLQAMDLSTGSNRAAMGATLNQKYLSSVEIPLPPLPEQRRIVAILDQADNLRTKRRQVLAHLDTLTQFIYETVMESESFDLLGAGEIMPRMRNGVSPATGGRYLANVLTMSAITSGTFAPGSVKSGLFASEPPPDKRVSSKDFLVCRGNGNLELVGVGVSSPIDRMDLVFPDTVIAGRVEESKATIAFLEVAWRQRTVRRQIESLAALRNQAWSGRGR